MDFKWIMASIWIVWAMIIYIKDKDKMPAYSALVISQVWMASYQ